MIAPLKMLGPHMSTTAVGFRHLVPGMPVWIRDCRGAAMIVTIRTLIANLSLCLVCVGLKFRVLTKFA